MSLNLDTFVFDQWRFIELGNLDNGKMVARLTSVEDPQIEITNDKEEITDANGSLITTINRAKKATFSGTNTLFSFDLFALQNGVEKEIATDEEMIEMPITEILSPDENGVLTLGQEPTGDIPYVYVLEKNQLNQTLSLDEDYTVNEQEITLTDPIDGGSYLVSYTYNSANVSGVSVSTENFPTATSFKGQAYVRDTCTDEIMLVWIIADKCKLDPSQLTIAFNSTGGHPITIDFLKDYCSTDSELFHIYVVKD